MESAIYCFHHSSEMSALFSNVFPYTCTGSGIPIRFCLSIFAPNTLVLLTSFIASLNIMYSKSSLFFFCFNLLNVLCILILFSAIWVLEKACWTTEAPAASSWNASGSHVDGAASCAHAHDGFPPVLWSSLMLFTELLWFFAYQGYLGYWAGVCSCHQRLIFVGLKW